MDKLWKKFFGQVDFNPLSRNDPPITFEQQQRRLSVWPEHGGTALWEIELAPEGELRARPDFVHSGLLGASRLSLYNKQGDEQAIVCALNGQLCLMLSDPTERFAENRKFPKFFDETGEVELAYYAVVGRSSPPYPTFSLTLLTPDGSDIKGSLVFSTGARGCLLLKAMPSGTGGPDVADR